MIAMSLNIGDGPHLIKQGNMVDVVSSTGAVTLLNKHDCIKQTQNFFITILAFGQ